MQTTTQQSTYHNVIEFKNRIDIYPHILVDCLWVTTTQHPWESFVMWGVHSHKCECPQIMNELGIRGKKIVAPHHLPCLHCNICRHTKKTPKAKVFGQARGEFSKPAFGLAHHLLSNDVSIRNRNLFKCRVKIANACGESSDWTKINCKINVPCPCFLQAGLLRLCCSHCFWGGGGGRMV